MRVLQPESQNADGNVIDGSEVRLNEWTLRPNQTTSICEIANISDRITKALLQDAGNQAAAFGSNDFTKPSPLEDPTSVRR